MKTPYAVIMAGGRGERLWPLSTEECPKQFLRLFGARTLLQETAGRIQPLVPWENTLAVVGKGHAHLVSEQLPSLPVSNVIVEPVGRGTAPCVGLAALYVSQIDPKGIMIILPADHIIQNGQRFLVLLEEAVTIASEGTHLVTLGISPSSPATGYGYIRASTPCQKTASGAQIRALEVERFTEKPDLAKAESFLREGGYFWNSGMFVWRADTILSEIKEHIPPLYEGLLEIERHLGGPDEAAIVKEVYSRQRSLSIDYGVMEKSTRTCVLPTGDIGWSDVGDWSALDAALDKDEHGNVVLGRHLGVDTHDTTVISRHGGLIATLGISNLVIVDTNEVLLVMDKMRAQEVKDLLREVEQDNAGKGHS